MIALRSPSKPGLVGAGLLAIAASIEAGGLHQLRRGQGRSHGGMRQTCGRSPGGGLWEGS